MAGIQAGSAEREFTPERSVPMGGNGPIERWSTGAHDPLSISALVLDDGETTVGIVSADLLWVSHELTEAVHGETAAEFPVDGLVVGATHTHSGPYLPVRFEEAVEFHPPELGFTDEAVADVRATVREQAVEALVEAYDSRAPATIRFGSAHDARPQFNRRSNGGLKGEVETGGRDVDPRRDVDPELVVLHAETDASDAVVYAYALHTTTMGDSEFSADWPRIVTDRVRDEVDEAAHTLFLNGAAGDIVPRNSYDWDERYGSRAEFSRAIGAEVADAVLAALEGARTLEDPTLDATRREVELPLRSVDREAVERRRRELADRIEREGFDPENPLSGPPAVRERLYLDQRLALDDWEADTLPATVQHVGIGAAGVITLPGEPFVRHGLDLKERARANPLLVAGYANGMLGYLPTARAFEFGGYEVETSRLGPEAIEELREAAFSLVE